MFEPYYEIASRYQNLPLHDERKLITQAKRGKVSAKQELILYQTGFILFRINAMLYPSTLVRCGEDIIHECMKYALEKVTSYNLRYRNKSGELHPVYFRTYLWKGITRVIMGSVKRKKEICFSDLSYFESNNQ